MTGAQQEWWTGGAETRMVLTGAHGSSGPHGVPQFSTVFLLSAVTYFLMYVCAAGVGTGW